MDSHCVPAMHQIIKTILRCHTATYGKRSTQQMRVRTTAKCGTSTPTDLAVHQPTISLSAATSAGIIRVRATVTIASIPCPKAGSEATRAHVHGPLPPLSLQMVLSIPSEAIYPLVRWLTPHGPAPTVPKWAPPTFRYSGQVFEAHRQLQRRLRSRTYFLYGRLHRTRTSGGDAIQLHGGNLKPWAQELLLQWAVLDPVSQKEIDRNNVIYRLQHNRNPFIDYPELAEMIFGSDTNLPFVTGIPVSFTNCPLDHLPKSATLQLNIQYT